MKNENTTPAAYLGPTAQELLRSYLKPCQWRRLALLMTRLAAEEAREELCAALLDYAESGLMVAPLHADTAGLFRLAVGLRGSAALVKPLRTPLPYEI